MVHGTGNPIFPSEDTIDKWRIGIAAYRRAAQDGIDQHQCFLIGRAAIMAEFPEISPDEAAKMVCDAVGWITRSDHKDWFYAGRPEKKWIWPPTAEGVGLKRWVNGELK